LGKRGRRAALPNNARHAPDAQICEVEEELTPCQASRR
jgi:hypothetical protein